MESRHPVLLKIFQERLLASGMPGGNKIRIGKILKLGNRKGFQSGMIGKNIVSVNQRHAQTGFDPEHLRFKIGGVAEVGKNIKPVAAGQISGRRSEESSGEIRKIRS